MWFRQGQFRHIRCDLGVSDENSWRIGYLSGHPGSSRAPGVGRRCIVWRSDSAWAGASAHVYPPAPAAGPDRDADPDRDAGRAAAISDVPAKADVATATADSASIAYPRGAAPGKWGLDALCRGDGAARSGGSYRGKWDGAFVGKGPGRAIEIDGGRVRS